MGKYGLEIVVPKCDPSEWRGLAEDFVNNYANGEVSGIRAAVPGVLVRHAYNDNRPPHSRKEGNFPVRMVCSNGNGRELSRGINFICNYDFDPRDEEWTEKIRAQVRTKAADSFLDYLIEKEFDADTSSSEPDRLRHC